MDLKASLPTSLTYQQRKLSNDKVKNNYLKEVSIISKLKHKVHKKKHR